MHDEAETRASSERIAFWRHDGPDGAEFLKATYRELRFAPHAHDRYLFALITDGALEIIDPGRSAIAAAGQGVLYNHDQLYWGGFVSRGAVAVLSIDLAPDYLNHDARELGA